MNQECVKFQERINKELLKHKVITHNPFTQWFAKGEANFEQVKAFIVQFSVFSNLFLIAQLKKMINADSLEGMRASKEILANEIGVIFKNKKDKKARGKSILVSTEGTVEGGTFRFQAGHFEWLLKIASTLNLSFQDIGKRRYGTASTLHFCDELARLYGNENYEISQAASYAVENWAAAGFWKELVQGLKKFRVKYSLDLPLAFFTWHDRLEEQHALHTQEELEEYFLEHKIDQDKFIKHGNEMMDAIWVFWDGLDKQRKKLVESKYRIPRGPSRGMTNGMQG
ncbi:MAG: hypothetical protein HYW47_06960 [Deltaproteobacteria bacterium]|nr:hypothetical protein [Deltaproteobacteria bacterium]